MGGNSTKEDKPENNKTQTPPIQYSNYEAQNMMPNQNPSHYPNMSSNFVNTEPSETKNEDESSNINTELSKSVYQSFNCAYTIKAHSLPISIIILLSTGEIASAGLDEQIKIWKKKRKGKLQLKKTFTGHEKGILTIKEAPKKKAIISAGCDKSIKIWDLKSGECIYTIMSAHTENILSIDFSRKYNLIISGSDDTKIKIWRFMENKPIKVIKEHKKSVTAVVFIDDYNLLCSGGDDKKIKIYSIKLDYKNIKTFNILSEVDCIKYIKPRLIASCEDGNIYFYNAEKYKKIYSVRLCNHPVHDFDIKKQEEYLLIASSDGKARMWNKGTGKSIVMMGHQKSINGIIAMNDGSIVTGSSDCTMKVWESDLETIMNYQIEEEEEEQEEEDDDEEEDNDEEDSEEEEEEEEDEDEGEEKEN